MEEILHIAEHVIEHSISDTLYLIPMLYITYLLMEWIEHKSKTKTQDAIKKAGAAGPLIGGILGVVPQCGFSAMAATLYAGRVITIGTLIAVFLSTSDEMLPIFIAQNAPISTILSILLTKLCIGVVCGFAIDAIYRAVKKDKPPLKIHEICERSNCGCVEGCEECSNNPASVYEHADDCLDGCDHKSHVHDHSHDDSSWKHIALSALKHTVQVTIFIFLITIALNTVIETIGEDSLADFLADNRDFSVLTSAVVGLIPNCAASIVIADLYLEGILGSGAMLAGLLVSSGVGLLILFQTNRHWKENVAIVFALLAIGIVSGFIVNALGIVF